MSRLAAWPVVAIGAIVWKEDRILLIRRGTPPRQGLWSIPGGRQEAGETVSEAAVRELREEAGIRISVAGMVAVVDLIDHDERGLAYHYTVIDVDADWIEGDLQAGDDAEEARWVEPDALAPYDLPAMQVEVIRMAAVKRRQRMANPRTSLNESVASRVVV